MKKFLCASAMVLASASAALAEYPERPINMIVAFSAGGGTDVAARTFAPFIEKHLGNDASVVVLNRTGAGGEIGFTELSRAEPDGYTIGFINSPGFDTIPIQREARYSLESFAPIANVVQDPYVFAVNPDSGIETLEDLVAQAKERPGEVTFGTTGPGTGNHLSTMEFQSLADVELRHIPYPGAADVRAAILGGHIDIAIMGVSEAISAVNAGDLTALGQMGKTRWEGAPDIPTFTEQGYDLFMSSMRGIGAPAGTPDDVIAKLEDAIRAAVEDPEFQERAAEQQLPLDFLDSEAYTQTLTDRTETFKSLWESDPWVTE